MALPAGMRKWLTDEIGGTPLPVPGAITGGWWKPVVSGFKNIGGAAGDAGGAVDSFWQGLKQGLDSGNSTAAAGMDQLKNTIVGKANEAAAGALDAIGGLVPGIRGMTGAAGSAAFGVADTVARALRSPNGYRIGADVSGMFASGLSGAAWQAGSAARSVAGAVARSIDNVNAYGSGQSITASFAAGIRSLAWQAGQAALDVAASVAAALPGSPAKIGPFSGPGWTPFRGRALVAGFAHGIAGASYLAENATADMIRGVDRTISGYAKSGGMAAELRSTISSDDFGSGISEHVEAGVLNAFNGSRLEIDGAGVTKLVNKTNRTNVRRGMTIPHS